MPLSASNIVQSNAGASGATGVTSIAVTLPSPTTGGTVIIGVTSDELISTPNGFVREPGSITTVQPHCIFRKQTSTGESSWDVSFAQGALAAWWVYEVSGLDAEPVDQYASTSYATATSRSTGTTPVTLSGDLLLIASHAAYTPTSATVTWSGQTNGFVETHDVSTTYTGGPEASISASRRLPGAAGAYETTATASTSATLSAILIAYRAASAPATNLAAVPVGSAVVLAARVTARDATSTSLALYTTDATVQGSLSIDNSTLAVTGAMARDLSLIPVSVAAQSVAVGDVLQSDTTGEAMVVREVWATSTGFNWSSTVDRRAVYSTSGWTKIGSASLS